MNMANLLAQAQGGAAKGVDAPAHLRQAEAGLGRGRPDIGREQQFHPAAGAIAVDGGDDGFAVGTILQQALVDHLGQFRSGGQIARQIGAGAK